MLNSLLPNDPGVLARLGAIHARVDDEAGALHFYQACRRFALLPGIPIQAPGLLTCAPQQIRMIRQALGTYNIVLSNTDIDGWWRGATMMRLQALNF
eukprot:1158848-Pelagomonas_calceolata.AAC.12